MSDFEGRSDLGQAAMRAIERARPDIAAICNEIFENPELASGEERAAALLPEFLASSGFAVEPNLAGMPTAFQADNRHFDSEAMRKGLRHGEIAILAEYDADIERGHASGRHLVAGAALASAIGVASSFSSLYGRVTVIGCPAASTGEGKRRLAEAGVFEPFDAVLGARPVSTGAGFQPTINGTGDTIATSRLRIQFEGPSGSSDARQRLATAAESIGHDLVEPEHLDVVITDDGIELDVRSRTNADLALLVTKLRDLVTQTALDTGATAHVAEVAGSPAMNVNRILARRIKTFGDNIGLKQDRTVKSAPTEVSDWGHVSLVTSTVEAAYPISTDVVTIGSDEFKRASVSDFAYDQMITVSMVLARTGMDLIGDIELRGYTEGELIRTLKAQGVARTPRRWLGVHPVLPRESSNGHGPSANNAPPHKSGA